MSDYNQLWNGYHSYAANREGDQSERIVLEYIKKYFKIESLVDFGCAIGRWCRMGKELGVKKVLGIDGDYVNRDELVIEQNEFWGRDLSTEIILPEKFDLAISLEVAEHIPEEKSDIFIGNLTKASDLVLFSAAIPRQGGDFHYNEQLVSYWAEKFAKFGYKLYDCVRPYIWNNNNVMPMYRQNIVVFASDKIKMPPGLPMNYTTDIIHPQYWFWRRNMTLFPFHLTEKNSTIVLYGAGNYGVMYYKQLVASNYAKKIIWVDKNIRSKVLDNIYEVEVFSPEVLKTCEFDYCVVAIKNEPVYKEIVSDLTNLYGVDKDKIVWHPIELANDM